uniref:Probable Xaa-Pro aminopeptidase P n=1 Tax=Bionectria ochroleuca TaxID=29856 RepID=A0A8H7K8T0_BIOOC
MPSVMHPCAFPKLTFFKAALQPCCLASSLFHLSLNYPTKVTRPLSTVIGAMATTKVDTTSRLAKLRSLMKERNVHVYIIPSEDNHSSEYIAASDSRREYISGFTGSAGVAVVTPESAILSTDGRYIIQATKQLDANWKLFNSALQDAQTWQDWSAEQAAGGKVVAVDPSLLPSSSAKKLSEKIQKAGGAELLPLEENLVDLVWGDERPARPQQQVFLHPDNFSGRSLKSKLDQLRQELDKKNAAGFVVSMLDEIAWLFNLRGSDIPYNPVFFSYAVVTPESATLYINGLESNDTVTAYLAENNVQWKPYDSILSDARLLQSQVKEAAGAQGQASPKHLLVSNRASWALHRALGGDDLVDEVRSPISDAKAIKNEKELEGMRACHIRDGAALIEFFAWLEDQLVVKKAVLNEVEADKKLISLREKQELYVDLSFPTISSTGANAAVIHYKPQEGDCSVIDVDKVYLCDSGAQYKDGTTDTTRTLHFGTPTDAEKEAYTLVLKGNIALDRAVFPKGTTGYSLDTLARQYLWQYGLDYRHGTGHGVGSYLNVHEGPIGIGTRAQYVDVALSPGNVLSNEPGYYVENSFGIRIENIIMVREVATKFTFGDKPYLGFEHVTMVPYCQRLIDVNLLTDVEKTWINNYHAEILEKTGPFFENDPLTTAWLKHETQAIV